MEFDHQDLIFGHRSQCGITKHQFKALVTYIILGEKYLSVTAPVTHTHKSNYCNKTRKMSVVPETQNVLVTAIVGGYSGNLQNIVQVRALTQNRVLEAQRGSCCIF